MKKIIGVVVVVVALGLVVAVFGRNILARSIIVEGLKKTCGLGVSIGKLDIGLPHVSILELTIYNPRGFKDKIMADIPEAYVDFDIQEFFKNKVHLGVLRINIRELNIIVDAEGKLNVNSLALLLPKPSGKKPPEVLIDELSLKIDTVLYKSYFPANMPTSKEFNLNLEETFHDVTNPQRVASDVVKKILARIGIANLATFDGTAEKLKEEIGSAVQETAKDAQEQLQGIFSK